jgi:uncharacterized membrane protein YeaQ/YmgE (transglycosylase-associated protein family)
MLDDLQSLSILIITGIVTGFLVSALIRGYGLGLVGNMIIGVAGALLAAWLATRYGVAFEIVNPLVTSIAYAAGGAAVFLLLIGFFARAN